MLNLPVGPLFKTQRVEVPGTGTYVEIRQERYPNQVGWAIEHGTSRFGHSGTWGRSDVTSARKCFAEALAYETTR